jgi:hypothetical protein
VNPFRAFVIAAVVVAVLLFAGFIAVHFFGVVLRPESLGAIATGLRAA